MCYHDFIDSYKVKLEDVVLARRFEDRLNNNADIIYDGRTRKRKSAAESAYGHTQTDESRSGGWREQERNKKQFHCKNTAKVKRKRTTKVRDSQRILWEMDDVSDELASLLSQPWGSTSQTFIIELRKERPDAPDSMASTFQRDVKTSPNQQQITSVSKSSTLRKVASTGTEHTVELDVVKVKHFSQSASSTNPTAPVPKEKKFSPSALSGSWNTSATVEKGENFSPTAPYATKTVDVRKTDSTIETAQSAKLTLIPAKVENKELPGYGEFFDEPWIDIHESKLNWPLCLVKIKKNKSMNIFKTIACVEFIDKKNLILNVCPLLCCRGEMKEVDEIWGNMYQCKKCKEYFSIFDYRFFVKMRLRDTSGVLGVIAQNGIAEVLLDITPRKFASLSFSEQRTIINKVLHKPFQFELYKSPNNGTDNFIVSAITPLVLSS